MNEQDQLVELLAGEQKKAAAAGHGAVASLCEALAGAVRKPPVSLSALEGAKAKLPPGSRVPAAVDRAFAHLRAQKPGAARASGAQPAAGAARASGPQPAAGAARASGAQPAAGAARASGPQPAAGAARASGPQPAAGAIAPRAPAKPVTAGKDPMAWLNQLLAQLKAFIDGLLKKPPAAPAAPVRRRPEPKLPPPMSPEEQTFFDGLSQPEQATYKALPRAQRDLARQGPEGRSRLVAPEPPPEAESAPAGNQTARLTAELFAVLGEGPEAPSTRGALRGVVQQTVANLLRETGGNVAVVKTRGLLSLLDQTEFSGLLLTHVEREVAALPPSTRKGAQSYLEAFKRLRPELIEHARKLVYPGLSAPELIGALVDVVVEVVDQQPRTGSRRGPGARGKKVAFQGRFIRG